MPDRVTRWATVAGIAVAVVATFAWSGLLTVDAASDDDPVPATDVWPGLPGVGAPDRPLQVVLTQPDSGVVEGGRGGTPGSR